MNTKRLMLAGGIALALHGLNPVHASIEAQDDANFKKTIDASHKAEEQVAAYYVRYAKGKKASITAAIESSNFKVDYEFDRINTVAVSFPKGQENLLSALPDVEFFEPVPEYKMMAQVTPWNIDQFQARDVWDADRDGNVDPGAPDGSGVKFCIIDSGFYAAHDDFQGITHTGLSQIPGEAYTEDGNGHGTHVAGTANAMNNNIGVVGVMPGGADLHIVKIFNNSGVWSTGNSNLGAAIQNCRDNGANAISMSLGGPSSVTEELIFQDLYDNDNIIHIAAAGNDGNATRSYPASYESVISVAALDESEAWASFSQFPATSHDPNNPPANTEWDVVELSGGGAAVLSTLPGPPHSNVPLALVTHDGNQYAGNQIADSDPGDVTSNLVSGGLCEPGDVDGSWNGAVVLCERGNIAFSDKINNVDGAGGLATIIYNNEAGNFSGTCQGNCPGTGPALSLSQADGQFLLANALGDPTQVLVDDGTSSCNGCIGSYGLNSGTSMATPGVAAGIAWAWDACGGPNGITNKELRQLLRDSAKDLTGANYGAGYDDYTGFGLVQLRDALELGNQLYGSTCPIGLSVSPSSIEVCTMGSPSDAVFTVTLEDNFNGTANMTSSGVPAGANGSYTVDPVMGAGSTDFVVTNLAGLASADSVITLTATDNSDPMNSASSDVNLITVDAAPSGLSLASPADGATDQVNAPELTWNASAQASAYDVEIATDSGFTNVIESAQGVTGTSYQVQNALSDNTTYYWRVTAANVCGNEVSAVYSFTTANQMCTIYTSTDVPVVIAPTPAPGDVTSTLDVADTGAIIDVNVVDLSGLHTWVNDLVVTVTSPASTTVELWNQVCNSEDNFDLNLDDEAAAAPLPCPPADGGTYQPSGSLSDFDGEDMSGTWTMTVNDSVDLDGGTLQAWGLQICTSGQGPSDLIFENGFE